MRAGVGNEDVAERAVGPPLEGMLVLSVLSISGWLMLAQVLFVPMSTTSLPGTAVL